MRLFMAVGLALLVAACSSNARFSEPELQQELKIKCVASNKGNNGCKTRHSIAVSSTYAADGNGLPSLNGLRDPEAEQSEF